MTAEDAKKLAGLRRHPREGGWYVRTYEASELVAAEGFAGGRGARGTGTAIYYLLEPDTFSEMHRLQSDEVFHFYSGDAVEMLQLREGGRGTTIVIGNDLLRGQCPQAAVERGVWQGSRLVKGGPSALPGGRVTGSFQLEDYETCET